MTAAELTPGIHLRGLILREVDGVLVEDIPVVHRARRRSRDHRAYSVHVTYDSGHHGRYDPNAHLDVLEATR